MDFAEVVNIALPIVYVLVGAALVWLVIELVMTLRKTRKTVDDLKKQVEPTLANVQELTEGLKPVVAKVDPLVERISLTVDATNLEIMRVDQILDDVNDITGSLSSAVDAVDTAANAPIDLVNSVSNRVRNVFKPRKASSESVALGQEKAESYQEVPTAGKHGKTVIEAAQDTVKAASVVAQDVAKAASEAADEAHERTQQRKAEREAATAARQEAAEKASVAASHMADAVHSVAEADATAAKDKYFTYGESDSSQSKSETNTPSK
ncbi:MAG: DUF948 domain-containing protein [Raoultibacter sp.]